jgi:putative membrane protein
MKMNREIIIGTILAAVCLGAGTLQAEPATPTTSEKSSSQGQDATSQDKQSSSAAQESTGNLSSQDEKFAREAAKGGMTEVELGRLGTEKAQSSEVKQLAQRILQDHTKANQELTQIAQQKGLDLPKQAEQKHVEHLKSLSGNEFDKAYVQHMVKDHKKDIKKFERASTECQDADLKQFASKTLPTLKEHYRMAHDLEARWVSEGKITEPAGAEQESEDSDSKSEDTQNEPKSSNTP